MLYVSVSTMRKLYDGGMTQREIAQTLETTQKAVYCFMRRWGIKARTAAPRDQWGEKHNAWKGSNASIRAMHRRVDARLGKPQRCEDCGTTDKNRIYEWANMTGQYDVIADYRRLCRSCHRKYDMAASNFSVKKEKL